LRVNQTAGIRRIRQILIKTLNISFFYYVVDSLQDINAAKCHIYPKEKAFFQLAECFPVADNPGQIK
jgi:hypothetical protein